MNLCQQTLQVYPIQGRSNSNMLPIGTVSLTSSTFPKGPSAVRSVGKVEKAVMVTQVPLIIIMHNKLVPVEYSTPSQKLDALSQQSVEHCTYEAFIRKESLLFSSWKAVGLTLVESPHEELLLAIRKPREGRAEEVVNLTHSRISKKLVLLGKYYAFGVIIPSKRKYMLACPTEAESLALYAKIARLRNEIKARHQMLGEGEGEQKAKGGPLLYDEGSGDGLQFEKCEEDGQGQCFSTNAQTPKREPPEIPLGRRQRPQQLDLESFCTAMEDRSPEQPQFEQAPLHLRQALSSEEVEWLQSDEEFKLLYNFSEGRFLGRRREGLKVNLLLASSLGAAQLVESFFHLELWNQRVKHFSVVSRIDEGIYLARLELHRRSLFSRPAFAFLLVHTCTLRGDPVIVFRSLPQDHFPAESGHWLRMNLCVRVKQPGEDMQRLMNISASFESQRDFEEGVALLEETKTYQLFLRTTGHLPHPTLEWQKQQQQQQQQLIWESM